MPRGQQIPAGARMREEINSLKVQLDVQERLLKRYKALSAAFEETLRAVMIEVRIHPIFIQEMVDDCYRRARRNWQDDTGITAEQGFGDSSST